MKKVMAYTVAQQAARVEDGWVMNATSPRGLFAATVTWIPMRTYPPAELGETLDPEHKMASRAALTEQHIPLH
jgi:hypothetical protein